MRQTVIQYVLSRLFALGVTDIFGVPGDFSFPVNDAICQDGDFRWIGDCNELNAAYAADGYARIRGVAALCTTYGVGELSAINGIAGSYAEHLPVFHLVGMPASGTQKSRKLVHHTLGNGQFDLFYHMTEPVVCGRAILTPDNCLCETERLIAAALYHRRPVYMAFPADYADMPVNGTAPAIGTCESDPPVLETAVDAIIDSVTRAKSACVLPGVILSRCGLGKHAADVVTASGLPFATMFMDKCVLDETHPNYVGMYDGRLMNEEVREFVEGCDCVIQIGALMTDLNSGAFTARIDRARSINIMHHHVRVGHAGYSNVEMRDVLEALAKRIPRRTDVKGPLAHGLGAPKGNPDDRITAEYLYPRWQQFLRPGDVLIAETGTASMGLGFADMPEGSTFQNQTLWGAIGWATPAAFGAALADEGRRTVLVTGEGAHQLTAQEVSMFCRYGLKPIIFVLNNNGYLIERLLCKDPDIYYNDLAEWRYHLLPEALGCDNWFTARATTCGELDAAIWKAESCGSGAYIEVVTDTYVAPPLPQKLHDSLKTFYASSPKKSS
ncbi:MAG: alpha-keto acid decarboxylase family protein [Deltaproteobacteria bacterium]|nr:alpha-keto acid decarboxylase family protein [Deltaproteobacteria bacterium]